MGSVLLTGPRLHWNRTVQYQVFTRGTPPRWRVAGQRAGACR